MVFVNLPVEISTEKRNFQHDFHHFVESHSTLNHFYIHFNTFLKKIKCFSKIYCIFSKIFFIWKSQCDFRGKPWKNSALLNQNHGEISGKNPPAISGRFSGGKTGRKPKNKFFEKIAKKVLTKKIKSAIIALA